MGVAETTPKPFGHPSGQMGVATKSLFSFLMFFLFFNEGILGINTYTYRVIFEILYQKMLIF
jgi:hypothetical protein